MQMQIEIRLRALLRKYHLNVHGVQEELAKFCKCHRHSIGKLLRNDAQNPSLETLGKVSEWLGARIPSEQFPQALFGAKPAKLWSMITEAAKATVYLGEYHEIASDPDTSPGAVRWLSRRDVEVVGALTRAFSTPARTGGHQPVMVMKYVPVRYAIHANLPKRELKKDIKYSEAVFRQMRREPNHEVSLVIGSQRVSHVTELLVSDVFHCPPFKPVKGPTPGAPFHLVFRGRDRIVPSCFGGLKNPPGRKGRIVPGIYFLGARSQWDHCPWVSRETDGGIVITSYEPSSKSLELALFGFSGRGTEALGRALVDDSEPFWGHEVAANGRLVGVYVCRFNLAERIIPDQGEVTEAKDLEVIPLSRKVLKRFLKKPAG